MNSRMSVRGLAALFAVAAIAAAPAFAGPVNVNKAGAEEIARELKGVGLKTARNIVAFREKQGPFKSVEQLADVKGIGDKLLEKNRADIKLQ